MIVIKSKHEILSKIQELKKEKNKLESIDLSNENNKIQNEIKNINEKIKNLEWLLEPSSKVELSSFKKDNIEIDLA